MLADTLAALDEKSPKPVYLIVGMMGQKDALGFLAPFRGLVRAIYTVPIPGAHEAPPQPGKPCGSGAGSRHPGRGSRKRD